MSKTIVLELEDADYERLLQEAQAEGQKVEELAARRLLPNGVLLPEAQAASASPLPVNEAAEEVYIAYPGFAALRPEVQQAALSLAERHGGLPDAYAHVWWETMAPRRVPEQTQEAWEQGENRLTRHFGAINSGDPHSADNDRIDADLARYYLRELDGEEDAA